MPKPHAVREVEILTKGNVSRANREYAVQKIEALEEIGHEPVLAAAVKLKLRTKTALDFPAIAEATLDVNGTAIRAHASGQHLNEAIDLLDDRLRRRLRRHRKRRETKRTEHVDAHPRAESPGFADVPVDEREVVRHKTLAVHPMTLEEAADEMDQLDHDFYLFIDLAHGLDRVVYRDPESGKVLVAPDVADEDLPGDTRPPIHPGHLGLAELTVEQAEIRLDNNHEPFVLFREPGNTRAEVLYRRFDGHYGLITPAD